MLGYMVKSCFDPHLGQVMVFTTGFILFLFISSARAPVMVGTLPVFADIAGETRAVPAAPATFMVYPAGGALAYTALHVPVQGHLTE